MFESRRACLEPLLEHPNVGDVRQCGLAAAVELVANRETQAGFAWAERRGHLVCEAARQKGVWLRPLGNVIVIMPPLCVGEEHIEQIVESVRYGIQATMTA